MARTSIDDLLKIQKSISAMEGLLNSSIHGSLGNCKAILNAITEAACIADSAGEIIYLNEAFEKRPAKAPPGTPAGLLRFCSKTLKRKRRSTHIRAPQAARALRSSLP